MSKPVFKKAAAIVCSLATLSVLGITATAQTMTPDDSDIDSMTNLVDGKINIIAGTIEAVPGEVVKYPVYIANNVESGFTASGVRLFYAEQLTPCTTKNDKLIVDRNCTAGDDIVKSFSLNEEERIIGLGTMGSEGEKDNGILYTVNVKVPEDAQPGDVFLMTLEVDKLTDANVTSLDYATIDGCIYIAPTEDPGEEEQPADPGEEEQPADPGEEEQPADPGEEEQPDTPPAVNPPSIGDIFGRLPGSGELHIYWTEDGSWTIYGTGKLP